MTNKSQLKTLGVAALVVAMLIGVGASAAAQEVSGLEITAYKSKAVQCFALARAQRLGSVTLGKYLNRIGDAAGTAGAVYVLGYAEGTIDAFASANAGRLGSYGEARVAAAEHFYESLGCSINEKI